MAKTEAMKRAEVMRKEWWKSKSNESSINDLVGLGVLHNKALRGWRASDLESFPDPQPGEIVVFEDFCKRGFGVPIHPFLQGLCLYYEIGICNLHPNSILLVSTFIHLCEAFGGFVRISISSVIYSVSRRRGLRGISDRWRSVPNTP
jgi:hypothetical protein